MTTTTLDQPPRPTHLAVGALTQALAQLAAAIRLLDHETASGGLRDAAHIASLARAAHDNADMALISAKHSVQFPD